MSRRNTEAVILTYFQQEPLEKAELMLKLVKDAVKKRKTVPTVKPYKLGVEEKKYSEYTVEEKKASA